LFAQLRLLMMDKTYSTPTHKDFYVDCIAHAVYYKFDRMHDESWYRVTSDKPLGWFLDNTQKITSSQLIVKAHQLRNEDERWNAGTHLEVNVELREGQTTYLILIEIDKQFLNYFKATYSL